MDGILPIYKPRGMTSTDVVSQLRRQLHMRRVGHSGTLDPNVDGVLPIALGIATKAVPALMTAGKIYIGEMTFGFATTTEDLDGEVVEQVALERPFSRTEIEAAMAQMTGDIIQIPPMFSAVKVNGRRLYDYARAGDPVERPKRPVTIYTFKITDEPVWHEATKTQTVRFEASVSKGTYIRTLAVDTGRVLGVPAVMSDLTRIQSGGFGIGQTVSLEQLADSDDPSQWVQPIEFAYPDLPQYQLTEAQWEDVQHGRFLRIGRTEPQLLLMYAGQMKAIYRSQSGHYQPETMFLSNQGPKA
ncbi:tRNA pseudouridine(55) synthase TruB [Lacticaseibacillus saniviri]